MRIKLDYFDTDGVHLDSGELTQEDRNLFIAIAHVKRLYELKELPNLMDEDYPCFVMLDAFELNTPFRKRLISPIAIR